MSDISETLAPNSDQLDAVDLASGPRAFIVEAVKVTGGDQPVSIKLKDFPRVYRPSKNMRRVLGACWGNDSSTWAGRAMLLYCDDKVRFGGKTVGGIRIRSLTHIDGPKNIPIIPTRGQSELWPVAVLTREDYDRANGGAAQ